VHAASLPVANHGRQLVDARSLGDIAKRADDVSRDGVANMLEGVSQPRQLGSRAYVDAFVQ
jgi:hypothetical protein